MHMTCTICKTENIDIIISVNREIFRIQIVAVPFLVMLPLLPMWRRFTNDDGCAFVRIDDKFLVGTGEETNQRAKKHRAHIHSPWHTYIKSVCMLLIEDFTWKNGAHSRYRIYIYRPHIDRQQYTDTSARSRARTRTRSECIQFGVWLYISYKKIGFWNRRTRSFAGKYKINKCYKMRRTLFLLLVSFLGLANIIRFRFQFTYEKDWFVRAKKENLPEKNIHSNCATVFAAHIYFTHLSCSTPFSRPYDSSHTTSNVQLLEQFRAVFASSFYSSS